MESLVRVTTRELVGLKRYASLLQTPRVRIKARGGGHYLSEQKGRGMEYAESRPYETGDDIRNLDWRVMARSGKAHTKLFREERERPVFFLIDLRRTMFFRHAWHVQVCVGCAYCCHPRVECLVSQ